MCETSVPGERHGGEVGLAGEVVGLGEGGAPFRVGLAAGVEAFGGGGGGELWDLGCG